MSDVDTPPYGVGACLPIVCCAVPSDARPQSAVWTGADSTAERPSRLKVNLNKHKSCTLMGCDESNTLPVMFLLKICNSR